MPSHSEKCQKTNAADERYVNQVNYDAPWLRLVDLPNHLIAKLVGGFRLAQLIEQYRDHKCAALNLAFACCLCHWVRTADSRAKRFDVYHIIPARQTAGQIRPARTCHTSASQSRANGTG